MAPRHVKRVVLDALAIPDKDGLGSMEKILIESGLGDFCGVDEAGRGPLAGPVVAAAVLYSDCPVVWKARDSKALGKSERETLYTEIVGAMAHAVGIASVEEVDRINILQASLLAMKRAVDGLPCRPSLLLVDGIHPVPCAIHSRTIVKGDARVHLIGAASIIAKICRDRLMTGYHEQYPEYGFDRHFGYPTAEHRNRIALFGPCEIHRKTFRGVREYVDRTAV